jgi:hypothetical protein
VILPLIATLVLGPPAYKPADAAFRMPPTAKIVVIKSKRELQVVAGESILRRYRVGLGLEPRMPKVAQGDYATPEGNYFVCSKNSRSKYGLSLGVSYPNPNDAERGLETNLISNEQHDEIISAFVKRSAPPMNTPLGRVDHDPRPELELGLDRRLRRAQHAGHRGAVRRGADRHARRDSP